MNGKNLDIYVASAGSGKTHTLTKEYLKLALKSPNYFKHIQAVTFTNKATSEMKERIIKELYILSREPSKSAFSNELTEYFSISEDILNTRAKNTLKSILNNYGYFRIKTIDSFFQEVIRSFFRELDIPATFELQLDKSRIIDDAIIRLIYEQKKQKGKTSLQLYAQEQIESGEGHNLVAKLKKLASQLFREDVKRFYTAQNENIFPDTKQILQFKREFVGHINTHKSDVRHYVEKFFLLFDKHNIDLNCISYGKSGVFAPFISFKDDFNDAFRQYIIKDKKPARFLNYLENCVHDPLKGLISSDKKKINELEKDKVLRFLDDGGTELMFEFSKKIFDKERLFTTRTINTILKNMDELGLLSDIKDCMDRINKETNTVLIDNNSSLLKQIIDNSDTPFIYEKIGSYIFHYMIDEFQDTSSMQYDNFMPLIKESLATQSSNLVVGDVKQSIYRFRNSDSNLLNTQIKHDLNTYVDIHNLQHNWRSSREIINFNNSLYQKLPSLFRQMINVNIEDSDLPESLKSALLDKSSLIEEYYNDVEQCIPHNNETRQGEVVIHSFDNDFKSSGEEILKSLVDTIAYLQRVKGLKPSDIAILTRKNSEAATIVQYLMNSQNTQMYSGVSFDVVSQEALNVDSSVIVRLILASFKYISRPNYEINRDVLHDSYKIICRNRNVNAMDMDSLLVGVSDAGRRGIYSCTESLLDLYSGIINDNDTTYILRFLDIVSKTKSNKMMDFAEFVEYWQQEGTKEKVILPENDNAISLMTIHKSKGLGFKAILMPMLYSDIIENNALNPTIIWSHSHVGRADINDNWADLMGKFNYPIPITYSKDLKNTAFASDYFDEMIKKTIDTLNLFYVATTRAKEELHLWLSSKESKEIKTLGDAVNKVLYKNMSEEYFKTVEISESLYNKDNVYNLSQIDKSTYTEDTIIINKIDNLPIEGRIAILREGLDYFEDNNPRKYGNTMHRILSRIISQEDIETNIDKSVTDGLITRDDADIVRKEIYDIINSDERAFGWFDKRNRILTEIPIIGGGINGSKRPDRVVIYPDNTADIIDYKFGQRENKHKKQVKQYMKYLDYMGYKTRGFLWYLESGSIIEEVK